MLSYSTQYVDKVIAQSVNLTYSKVLYRSTYLYKTMLMSTLNTVGMLIYISMLLIVMRSETVASFAVEGGVHATKLSSRFSHQLASATNPYLLERSADNGEVTAKICLLDDNGGSSVDNSSSICPPTSAKSRRTLGATAILRDLFLPVGYPLTVPQEYSTFQLWNIIQDLCSYLRGIMSTRALLEGMGVGRADTTAVHATIQWVFRDGASMLGGLLFTAVSSHDFGQNVKQWRLFADSINNFGITLDMIAPHFKDHFLAIICLSSVCKALCGISAGATNAVIAQHWGDKYGNVADVLAKNGAQHTVVSLIGLAMSVKFARLATSSPTSLWIVYFALTAIHFYANYKLMKVLALSSLNRTRYDMLVRQLLTLLKTERLPAVSSHHMTATQATKMLTENRCLFAIDEIARKEPILSQLIPRRLVRWMDHLRLKLHCVGRSMKLYPIDSVFPPDSKVRFLSDESTLDKAVELWVAPSRMLSVLPASSLAHRLEESRRAGRKYVIASRQDGPVGTSAVKASSNVIYVCFQYDITGEEQAQALLEAYLFQSTGDPTSCSTLAVALFPTFWKFLTNIGWKTALPILKPKNARGYDSSMVL